MSGVTLVAQLSSHYVITNSNQDHETDLVNIYLRRKVTILCASVVVEYFVRVDSVVVIGA
jgi:hypothetical protein